MKRFGPCYRLVGHHGKRTATPRIFNPGPGKIRVQIITAVYKKSSGLYLLARPIIQVLFERGAFKADSTGLTVTALVFFTFGIPFSSGNKVLKKAFFSLEDTATPVKVAGISVVFYLGLSFLLMQFLGIGGLALGLALTETLFFLILWVLLQRKIGSLPRQDILHFVFKILMCTACMAAALILMSRLIEPAPQDFWPKLVLLLAKIGVGIGAYGLSALIIIRKELRMLRTLIFSKK